MVNWNKRDWDWDWNRMPAHPKQTVRWQSPAASASRPLTTSARNVPLTPQQHWQRRQAAEERWHEKRIAEQQKQFTWNRERVSVPVTNATARERFLHTQSQAEREFRMARAALDNPMLRSVMQKMQHQPGMFEGVRPRDVGKFLNTWIARWGQNKEQDFDALRLLKPDALGIEKGRGRLQDFASEADWKVVSLQNKSGLLFKKRAVTALWDAEASNPLTGWQETAYQYASELGVDPVLLIMLIQNEINAKDPLDYGDYGLLWNIANARTFGLGEVSVFRAVQMLQRYPSNFMSFEDQYPSDIRESNGSYNAYAVGYFLYTNDEFNIAVAATYVRDSEIQIQADIKSLGVTVSDDPTEGTASITPDQVRQLVIVAYNTGWEGFSEEDGTFMDLYHERLQKYTNPADAARKLVEIITINQTHLNNVLSLQPEIEQLIEIQFGSIPLIEPTETVP